MSADTPGRTGRHDIVGTLVCVREVATFRKVADDLTKGRVAHNVGHHVVQGRARFELEARKAAGE